MYEEKMALFDDILLCASNSWTYLFLISKSII